MKRLRLLPPIASLLRNFSDIISEIVTPEDIATVFRVNRALETRKTVAMSSNENGRTAATPLFSSHVATGSKHKDTEAQRHKEAGKQMPFDAGFFVSLCLCIFVFTKNAAGSAE